MLGEAVVTCLFGRRGSGKSTLGAHLAASAERVIAFDPQKDYCGGVWVTCRSRTEVKNAILSQYGGRVRVSYVPDLETLDPIAEAVWLAGICRKLQRRYDVDHKPLTLLVDEAHLVFPNRRFAQEEAPLRRIVLQGRHDGIGLLVATQRPANLSTDVRGQAETFFAFAMPGKNDREAIAAIHQGAAAPMAKLEKYEFVKIDGTEVLTGVLNLGTGTIALSKT
ncbi:MAG: zonular occludens toxin domain-containing protein [Pseudomonadota bacterium]